MQRLFQVEEDQAEADRVLDNYLKKRVRDMMYQARVDCVKAYYRKRGESLDDTLASTMELEYEQYKVGMLEWFNDAVWPVLCPLVLRGVQD
jgi:tRNA A37 N6-isopentenylltransferase MiaA